MLYRFEDCTLDLTRGCLHTADREVELRPKSFNILRYLVENAGRLIAKEEIIAGVWSRAVVTDESLARCISDVRAAIADQEHKIIKTIPRRGYLFTANVTREGFAEAPGHNVDGAGPLHLPDSRASIAVLPFANMSGDPNQEYLTDGITEDIITELSRFSELLVIARNSTFHYKGRATNVRLIGRELGVRYVLEGSIRRSGDRVRISAQLVDAVTGAHRWAERYDRKLDDVFSIQDEITAAIVATLPGRLEAAQHDQLARIKPSSMAAYECVLAAKVLHHRSTREDNAEALKLIDRALELDPDYGHAHAWRGCILGQAWGYGWCKDKDATFSEVGFELDKAMALDDNDADVHRILAAVAIVRSDMNRARYHQDRALVLNPNYDLVVVQMGELFTWLGRAEEGVEWIRKAMQLNPHHPARFWSHLGKAHFVGRQYAQAIEAFMHLSTVDAQQHAFLAACYGWLGDRTAAEAHATRLAALDPEMNLPSILATMHYTNEADLQHLREGLIKAGMADR